MCTHLRHEVPLALSEGAGSLNGLTKGVRYVGCCKPKTSELCRGRQVGDPSGEAALASPGGAEDSENFGEYHSMYYTPSASHSLSSSPRGGAKGALRHGNRFLSDTSPGGLGNQRIGIMLRASSFGGIAAPGGLGHQRIGINPVASLKKRKENENPV